jgi:outer membrane lipoprotein SlyB
MSWLSQEEAKIESWAESEIKSTVVTAAEGQIETLIVTNAPTTEADAITLVNNNLSSLITNTIASIKNVEVQALFTLVGSQATAWLEGILDGAVKGVFAKVVGQVAGSAAGQGLAGATTNLAPPAPTVPSTP